jgi:hypothetical protein
MVTCAPGGRSFRQLMFEILRNSRESYNQVKTVFPGVRFGMSLNKLGFIPTRFSPARVAP